MKLYHNFKCLSHDDIDLNQILKDIKDKRNDVTGIIIQIHGKTKLLKPKTIKFVHSQREFNNKLDYKSPLIKQFNPEIYQSVLDKITIQDFLNFSIQINNIQCYLK